MSQFSAGSIVGTIGLDAEPQDDALKLENAVTRTADYDGAVFDFGSISSPAPPTPAAALVQVLSIHLDGGESYLFKLQESDDLSGWHAASRSVAVKNGGSVFIVPGFVSRRYVRLALAASGMQPSITYSAWLVAPSPR